MRFNSTAVVSVLCASLAAVMAAAAATAEDAADCAKLFARARESAAKWHADAVLIRAIVATSGDGAVKLDAATIGGAPPVMLTFTSPSAGGQCMVTFDRRGGRNVTVVPGTPEQGAMMAKAAVPAEFRSLTDAAADLRKGTNAGASDVFIATLANDGRGVGWTFADLMMQPKFFANADAALPAAAGDKGAAAGVDDWRAATKLPADVDQIAAYVAKQIGGGAVENLRFRIVTLEEGKSLEVSGLARSADVKQQVRGVFNVHPVTGVKFLDLEQLRVAPPVPIVARFSVPDRRLADYPARVRFGCPKPGWQEWNPGYPYPALPSGVSTPDEAATYWWRHQLVFHHDRPYTRQVRDGATGTSWVVREPEASTGMGMCVSADGRVVAAGVRDMDGTPRLAAWSLPAGGGMGQPIFRQVGAAPEVRIDRHLFATPAALAVSPDDRYLATFNKWGEVRLWDVRAQTHVGWAQQHDDKFRWYHEPREVAFRPDGRVLAAAAEGPTDGDTVHLFAVPAMTRIARLAVKSMSTSSSLAWSPDGKLLATCDGQDVVLWDGDTGAERRRLTMPYKQDQTMGQAWGVPLRVTFSPDGALLAVTWGTRIARDMTLYRVARATAVWDLNAGKVRFSLYRDIIGGDILDVAFSDDGRRLLTLTREGPLVEFDLAAK